MRKTFKSVCVPGLELNISPSPQGVAVTLSMDGEHLLGQGITLSREDAASVMLAIAEAAGVEPKNGVSLYGTPEQLRAIAFELYEYDKHLAKRTAEAEAQAKLEAEALELFNAGDMEGEFQSGPYDSFAQIPDYAKPKWLGVARKAREIAKEQDNGH